MDTSEQETVSLDTVAERIISILNKEDFKRNYQKNIHRYYEVLNTNISIGKDDN